jgi:hypothetical protein
MKTILPARVLDAAAKRYAEDGFDMPLALRKQVFARHFTGRWKPEWEALLADRKLPLAARLTRFYSEYRGNITRMGARLWNRAGLLGFHASGNFSATLEQRILKPVVRELRHEAGIKRDRPIRHAEIELVQMLHGAIAFPHTRAHIYGMNVYGRLPALVTMMVRVWLPGAVAEIRRLHRNRTTRP